MRSGRITQGAERNSWSPQRQRLSRRLRQWRLRLARHHRLIAAASVAASLALGLQSLAPSPAPTAAVMTARHDLAAGLTVTQSDVILVRWPSDRVPTGTVADPVGRVLASPARRGEPITDARLRGPGLLLNQPGTLRAAIIRLGSPTGGLVRTGDRVDVLAASGTGSVATTSTSASVIADDVLVLAGPPSSGVDPAGEASGLDLTGAMSASTGDTGSMTQSLIVAVDGSTALRLAAAASSASLSVVLRGSD